MKAVILAGGQGVRLRPLTYYFQKCMIPIGTKQKPLLEYIIRLLKHHNLKDILILAGYKHQQIQNYFEDGSRLNVKITYVIDRPDYKGTALALLNALEQGHLKPNEDILVYYGDILSNINLTNLIQTHLEKKAIATLALATGYRIRVGTAKTAPDGRITQLIEKPQLSTPVTIGILALNTTALQEVKQLKKHLKQVDIMAHLIPQLIKQGKPVYSYITAEYWQDIGSTERYEKLDHNQIDSLLAHLLKD